MRLRYPVLILATALALTACSANRRTAKRPTAARKDNASTFALDVDTASYTFAARQLNDGSWPQTSTVRPEEFLNAFDHHYAQPRGDGFAMHVDGSRLPEAHAGSSSSRLVRIGLQTKAESSSERRDANLTFVIDVSGSMAESGRLDLVQDALHYLVDQLQPSDAVAIVSFNDRASVVREMTRISDKDRLHEAIDRLKAGGSTNLGDGLITGYQLARESFRERVTNRVIILSDGLANTGTTDSATLVSRIYEEAAKEISLLGVGVGSDYGDKLMEELADKGDGFVVYISEQKQARELFVRRLPATLAVRAYDAKAQVVFDRSTVDTYQLIGYENRALADDEFRDDTVDGGEIGPGHSVTALYVVKLRAEAKGRVAQIKVRWLDPKTRDASESYETVNVDDVDGTFARSDADLKLCYVAAFFAEALRKQPAPGLEELAKIADDANADLDDPQVGELAALIRKAISNR